MWYKVILRNKGTGEIYEASVESLREDPEEAVELFAETVGLFPGEFETIYIRRVEAPRVLSSGVRPWRHSSDPEKYEEGSAERSYYEELRRKS